MGMKTLGSLVVAAVLAGCAGCSSADQPPPPDTFSIDSAFSSEQANTIRDGMVAWCEAVAWCPAEVTYSERGRFVLAHDYVRDSVDDESDAYLGDDWNVYIDGGSPHIADLHRLWLVAMHEAGHWGIPDHPVEAPALMAAGISKRLPLEIDAASRQAWCERIGCD